MLDKERLIRRVEHVLSHYKLFAEIIQPTFPRLSARMVRVVDRMIEVNVRLIRHGLAREAATNKSDPQLASLFSEVNKRPVRKRFITAIISLALALLSFLFPLINDPALIALCLGVAFVALADAALISWGMWSRDYGANAAEMEEVLEFLLKQMAKGDGPPGGYRKLFPDEARDTAQAPLGVGVPVGGR